MNPLTIFRAVLAAAVALFCALGLAVSPAAAEPAAENLERPVISGTAQEGETLRATTGRWAGDPVDGFTFAWLRCDTRDDDCAPISGATGDTYAAVLADTGHTLRARVTLDGVHADSDPTAKVLHAPPSGGSCQLTPWYGVADRDVFVVTCERWSDFDPYHPLTYRFEWWGCADDAGNDCTLERVSGGSSWPRGESTVSGFFAEDPTYGSTFRVKVIITAADGSFTTWSELGYLADDGNPHANPADLPVISGDAWLGQTLHVSGAQWNNDPTGIAYQWHRCSREITADLYLDFSWNSPTDPYSWGCEEIGGATDADYVVGPDDLGSTLMAQVIATNAAGTGYISAESTAFVVHAPPVNSAVPTITNQRAGATGADHPRAGDVLRASDGSWDTATAYSYRWERCDADGDACEVIDGATSRDYATGAADVGNTIRVQVTAVHNDSPGTAARSVGTKTVTSTDATLSNLTISSGTLTPGFASGTTAYTASVPNATTSVDIVATANQPDASITVGGAAAVSGNAVSRPLAVGANAIPVVVTAGDGETTRTYTLTITRAASSDAALSNLTVSAGTLAPTFASGTTAYTVSVPSATSTLAVTPTVNDAQATVAVSGSAVTSGAPANVPLNVGANTIAVVVTAQDGSTRAYTVTATRAAPASTDATLSNLGVSAGTLSPGFASGTTTYTVSVPHATGSIDVTPTVSEAHATVSVNGDAVTSGNPAPRTLAVGANTISVVVTAQDGTTTSTYTVTVTRAAAPAPDPEPTPDPQPEPEPTPDPESTPGPRPQNPTPPAAATPTPSSDAPALAPAPVLPAPAPVTPAIPTPKNGPNGEPRFVGATVTPPVVRWAGKNPQGKLWLSFTTSRKAKLKLTLQVRVGKRWKSLATSTKSVRKGANRLQLTGRWRNHIAPGKTLRLTMKASAGKKKWTPKPVTVTVVSATPAS